MNISSLFGNVNATPASNVGAVNTSSTNGVSSVPPPMGGAATAEISTPGQFLSAMQQLSQQNPTEFKAVAAQVAASFQNAASQTSGPQAQFLTQLANQFTQAAQTGTLSPTSPQGVQGAQGASATQTAAAGAAPHHHGHHHHAGGAGASSAVSEAFQSAMSILTQATGSASASSAASTGVTSP